MRKYTQRELLNEAWRDRLNAIRNSKVVRNPKVRGVSRVISAGVLGAAKNVANYLSPELYGLAKSARDIYKGGGSKDKVLADYIQKTRSIPIFKKEVTDSAGNDIAVDSKQIIDGSAEHIFKDTAVRDPNSSSLSTAPSGAPGSGSGYITLKQNAIRSRLTLKRIDASKDFGDGIFEIPFTADSKTFTASVSGGSSTINTNNGKYLAYLDKVDKDNFQVIGIKETD